MCFASPQRNVHAEAQRACSYGAPAIEALLGCILEQGNLESKIAESVKDWSREAIQKKNRRQNTEETIALHPGASLRA